ncbi:unnamed protein product, partial [Musa hybrid cultivar]
METCITLLPETGESRDATLHELLYISQSRAQTGVTVHEQTAMAASKPVLGLAATVLLLVVLMHACTASTRSQPAQNCSAALVGLATCASYAVPGSHGAPSDECCTAMKGVDRVYLCDTLNIISRMPAACKLSPVTCSDLPS